MKTIVVSFSGGKDSTATALLALKERSNETAVRLVFADTGHEHEETYRYITDYIPAKLGIAVDVVRADFSRQIEGKRKFIAEKWLTRGATQADIDRVLAVLQPTGVPFLDMCMWKGRFPSRMAQFCTQELKRYPLDAFMLDLLEVGAVESWQGVRRDESRNRAGVLDREPTPEGWVIVRPIAAWTAEQVVGSILSAGLELNPLYKLGMGRVGCMPCINCNKDELAAIGARFPEHVARVREWEKLVSEASKRGWTTFFTDRLIEGETNQQIFERLKIDKRIEWARTVRGGKQVDLIKATEHSGCSSVYGLCE